MSVSLLILVVVLTPLVSAPIVLISGKRLGARTGWAALPAALVSLAACLALWTVPSEERSLVAWSWVPRLGVNLAFTGDNLALFFGSLVTVIGSLVTVYSSYYLDEHYRNHGRFYCVLQLFMGTMLITVFSSNLLVLFTAWELTGITSFFLIGFFHEEPDSQRGARMAFLTTSATGLVLLIGIVLLQQIFGTLDLPRMLETPVPPERAPWLSFAFFCCFVGICGKSALFPFSYWLPNAMAAPTPVSAYLHSATLVKLGVFLTARLLPVFFTVDGWATTIILVGFTTYVLGALFAWMAHDLKAVLAHTTVAQLGLLVGQYAFVDAGGRVVGDALHIVNHTLYKACLFMVVGIIDHSTGGRDIRELAGLFRKMPLTGAMGLIGFASLAGVPFTTGFVSKELFIETMLAYGRSHPTPLGAWPIASFLLGSVVQVLVALRIARRVFFGAFPERLERTFHAPSLGIQLPPLVLASAVVYFGSRPAAFGRVDAVIERARAPVLALWHGFTPAALLSAGVFVFGAVLYWLVERGRVRVEAPTGLLNLDRTFDYTVDALPGLGERVDRALGFLRPSKYLTIVVLFTVTVALACLASAREKLLPAFERGAEAPADPESWGRWGVVAVISTAALFAAAWRRPVPQLFAVSLVGFCVAIYYVLYRAPDLALTQLLVEAATLILVLLVVLRLKRDGADLEPLPALEERESAVRVSASLGAGLVLGLGVLIFPNDAFSRAGAFYVQNTVQLAHGSNAVNTVVVDFRGFDTLLESTVLVIATLGCLGLLFRPSTNSSSQSASPAEDLFPVPFDLILKVVALGAFVPLNVFSLYVFLRGHNAPGGGFIAGLITALSLILLSFVLGVQDLRRSMRVAPMRLAVLGLSVITGAVLLPLPLGFAPLHHLHSTVAGISIGTPLLFDAGVFLSVVGVSLKLILPLMKSVHGLPAFVREEEEQFAGPMNEPIDLDPKLRVTFPPSARP